jgi:Lipoxygenase
MKIRQTLSIQEFPPTSNLDPMVYGNQKSTIKEEDILKNIEGFTVNKVNKEIEGHTISIISIRLNIFSLLILILGI